MDYANLCVREIYQIVADCIEEIYNIPPLSISDSTRFIEDLGSESMDHVEFSLLLQNKIDRKINVDEMYAFQTVGDVVGYLLNHRKTQPISD